MTDNSAAERDRAYYQAERAVLADLAEGSEQCEALAKAICERLVLLDQVDDAIAIERGDEGDMDLGPFAGKPVPWLQQRRGEIVMELSGATRQLQRVAANLEGDASRTHRSGRTDHIARGFIALADEGRRVVASYGPESYAALPDWSRISAIHEGIRRLESLQETELREEIWQCLRAHDDQRSELRAAGLTELADRVDAHPGIRRALTRMRAFGEAIALPRPRVDKTEK